MQVMLSSLLLGALSYTPEDLQACLATHKVHARKTKHKIGTPQELLDLCDLELKDRDSRIAQAQSEGIQSKIHQASLPFAMDEPEEAKEPKHWLPIGHALRLYDWGKLDQGATFALPAFDPKNLGRTHAQVKDILLDALDVIGRMMIKDMTPLYGRNGRYTAQAMPKVAGSEWLGVLMRPLYRNVEVSIPPVPDSNGASGSSNELIVIRRMVHQCMKHSGQKFRGVKAHGNTSGYLKVKIGIPEINWEFAHRIICWAFHGPPAPGQVVMHLCNCPRCMNPAHLKWGTQAENLANKQAQIVVVKRPHKEL